MHWQASRGARCAALGAALALLLHAGACAAQRGISGHVPASATGLLGSAIRPAIRLLFVPLFAPLATRSSPLFASLRCSVQLRFIQASRAERRHKQ